MTAAAQGSGTPAVRFEVASVKYSGTHEDHTTVKNGNHIMSWKPLEYKGQRVAADAPLDTLIEFAYSSVVVPYRQETPDWVRWAFYSIDAVAPAGARLDDVRIMLQHLLEERLGLQYHVKTQNMKVLVLSLGAGKPKLLPPAEGGVKPKMHNTWVFTEDATTLDRFAAFLSSVAGQEVVDQTGISGKYSFNIDLSAELSRDHSEGVGMAIGEAKRLGLTLKTGQVSRKVFVVDRANKTPTPN